MAKFAMMFLSMMLITVGCGSTSDTVNNPNATTDGSLCRGKADCPAGEQDVTGADNDANGSTDIEVSGVDNDNGGNTDVATTDPCAGYEVLANQKWECHYGQTVECVPECLVYEGATYIACGGGVSLVNNAVFVPTISNPTEVKMTVNGGSTCYNIDKN